MNPTSKSINLATPQLVAPRSYRGYALSCALCRGLFFAMPSCCIASLHPLPFTPFRLVMPCLVAPCGRACHVIPMATGCACHVLSDSIRLIVISWMCHVLSAPACHILGYAMSHQMLVKRVQKSLPNTGSPPLACKTPPNQRCTKTNLMCLSQWYPWYALYTYIVTIVMFLILLSMLLITFVILDNWLFFRLSLWGLISGIKKPIH